MNLRKVLPVRILDVGNQREVRTKSNQKEKYKVDKKTKRQQQVNLHMVEVDNGITKHFKHLQSVHGRRRKYEFSSWIEADDIVLIGGESTTKWGKSTITRYNWIGRDIIHCRRTWNHQISNNLVKQRRTKDLALKIRLLPWRHRNHVIVVWAWWSLGPTKFRLNIVSWVIIFSPDRVTHIWI